MDINDKFACYTKEAIKLESAYENLQRHFFALKEKLESSHQTLEKIISHMNEGLVFVKKEGKIALFNPAAAEILNLDFKKVIGSSYADFFPNDFFGFSMQLALKDLSFNRRIFLSINEDREIEVSTSSIPDKGLLLLLSNRFEQKKMEAGLDQAERLQELGEMAATLAHEIRNPLGGIEGFAQLLKRDLTEPSQQQMVGAILEGTQALNKLVTDVLDYARPLNLIFAPVDLVLLIHHVIHYAQAAENMPRCTFEYKKDSFVLSIDRDQIKHVLFNLLRNAKEAGASEVRIELQEGILVLKDNGQGISTKNLKKIFTPFFTTKTRGTGLGLAYSLAVVKAHGGLLEISSEIGHGTQITIKF